MAGSRCPSSGIPSRAVPRSPTSKTATGSKSSSFSCLPEQRFDRGDVLVQPGADLDGEIRIGKIRIDPGLGQPAPRIAPEERTADRLRPERLAPPTFTPQERGERSLVVLRLRMLTVKADLQRESRCLRHIARP